MKEVLAQIEADSRNAVRHQTWGHLYPDNNEIYTGQITACHSAYGVFVVISETVDGIEDSPWWFESMNDFIYEALKDEDTGVWVFDVTAQSVPDPTEWDEDENEWVESTVSRIYVTEVSRDKIL